MTELKLLQCRLDGRYDIEDCLGRGSYAEIYVARDRAATDERFRTVVVKALNVLLQGDQDPELERTLIQNFQNEATALDRVRHPNIISRLGHGTAIDLSSTAFHYIVLEYLSGGDLSAPPRRFAQHAITEFPEPIASKSWAASLLRVLERATQARAGDRYQTVQDFWDEFSDAALPPTQPLGFA